LLINLTVPHLLSVVNLNKDMCKYDHRKKKKADPSRLILLKLAANLEFLIVVDWVSSNQCTWVIYCGYYPFFGTTKIFWRYYVDTFNWISPVFLNSFGKKVDIPSLKKNFRELYVCG